jgi:hypothetical protein
MGLVDGTGLPNLERFKIKCLNLEDLEAYCHEKENLLQLGQ